MDDFDNLNSKTDSDLRQIAVAFGDFTPEEAESKTRDELLMAITGAKDIGDITAVDLSEEPVPVKAAAIPEPMKSTENQKSLDELIVDVGRTARFETNELADAMIKAEKKEKKVAKKVTEEAAKEPKEEKKAEAKAEKKPAKRTSKKAAKAEEAPADVAVAEAPAAEAPAEESKKAEKKPAAKAKKTRTSKKKEEAAEVKAEEPTPVEALAAAAEAEVPEQAPAAGQDVQICGIEPRCARRDRLKQGKPYPLSKRIIGVLAEEQQQRRDQDQHAGGSQDHLGLHPISFEPKPVSGKVVPGQEPDPARQNQQADRKHDTRMICKGRQRGKRSGFVSHQIKACVAKGGD